ncbi:MAG: hypothetical protein KatS3mg034_0626 [Vicingaceae bacterium]|nr:MAG: hypothetical protein KatS3mg034_0626 [Vicingaceae bacterium]
MKKQVILFGALALIIFMTACEKDLKINADKKEYTIVYGALNASDTAQYVRIERAFLGEKPIKEMAQNADSLQYPPGSLQVKLYEGDGYSFPTVINMVETNEIPKDPGYFTNERNTLFKTTHPINPDKIYKLEVINNLDNRQVSATTPIAHPCVIENPSSVSRLSFANNVYEYLDYNFRWTSGKNVRRYQVFLDFYYQEFYTNGDSASKKIRIFIGEVKTNTLDGGRPMEMTFNGLNFYKSVAEALGDDANVLRREIGKFHLGETGHCDLIIIGAAEELNLYMEVYAPSNTIVEEKPDYTNIENGLGIFSSINTTIRKNIPLSQYSIRAFEQNDFTKYRKFCDPEPNPQITSCQ